jgi:hypothetical protein
MLTLLTGFVNDVRKANHHHSNSLGKNLRIFLQTQRMVTLWKAIKKLKAAFSYLTFFSSPTIDTLATANLSLIYSASRSRRKPAFTGVVLQNGAAYFHTKHSLTRDLQL